MRDGTSDAIPRQRSKDLVVRAQGEETLVLDRRTGTVHCLPAEVARVWDACTGRNSLPEIASAAETDERIAAEAVDQLMLLDLLEVRAGFDRRKFLRRSAEVGAGAAAIPVIESVIASPAMAQTSPHISIASFVCSSTNGIVKNVYANLTGFTAGMYTIMVSIGPAPPPSNIAGTTWNGTPYTVTLPQTNYDVIANNKPASANPPPPGYRGLVPAVNPTPITITVSHANGYVKVFKGFIGPCDCSTTYCGATSGEAFTISPACAVSGTTAQANLTYTLTGGLPSATYYYTYSYVNSAGATVTNTYNDTTNANGFFSTTRALGSSGAFTTATPVTFTLRIGSATGPVVGTPQIVTVGPCPPATPNAVFTVTPSCAGTGSAQAYLTYSLTGGVPNLTYYVSYAASTGQTGNFTIQASPTDGSFSRGPNSIGNANTFIGGGTVTVTLRQINSSGMIVATKTVNVQCPPPTAGPAQAAPSGSSPAKSTPSSTAPAPAPTTSAPTTPPASSPSESPSPPASLRATGAARNAATSGGRERSSGQPRQAAQPKRQNRTRRG